MFSKNTQKKTNKKNKTSKNKAKSKVCNYVFNPLLPTIQGPAKLIYYAIQLAGSHIIEKH